jgi:hypothetical protein
MLVPHTLSESEALPSVGLFVECLLSGTQQRRLSVFAESRGLALGKEASLPSAKYWALDKEGFADCLL